MTKTMVRTVSRAMVPTVGNKWPNGESLVIRGDTTRLEIQQAHRAPTVAVFGSACVGTGVLLLMGVGGVWAALQVTGGLGSGGLLAVLLTVAVAHVPFVLLVLRSGPRVAIHYHEHKHVHVHAVELGWGRAALVEVDV